MNETNLFLIYVRFAYIVEKTYTYLKTNFNRYNIGIVCYLEGYEDK